MNAAVGSIYLESYLAPLAEWLAQEDVTDLYINRPGEIWVERLGAAPERMENAELTADVLRRLVRQIAAISAQGVNREHPLLSASLPDGARVQVVIPPATRGDIAIAIRKHVTTDLKLDDYRKSGALSSTQLLDSSTLEHKVVAPSRERDVADLLRDAVRDRRNILISGGTSSGKTTFANALLREVPSEERLIVIEDTPELQLRHENAVGLIAARSTLGEADISADDLLIAALRMRPDRVILGEIRGGEAVTFLRAVNTGHPGSITTIHADSPARAIDQLALLVMQTGTRMAWDDVLRYVKNSLDVIVQLHRRDGVRTIEAVTLIG